MDVVSRDFKVRVVLLWHSFILHKYYTH
jgi:hypothetical protein